MKYIKRSVALLLALCLGCLALLAGCSSQSDQSEPAAGTSSAATSGTSPASASEEDAAQTEETIVGQVSYVGSAYISVSVCTGAEDTQDWAALDPSTLTVSEETASIDTDDATEYLAVRAGLTETATRDDIAVGAYIVSCAAKDGTRQIILLESADAADADSAVSVTTDEQEQTAQPDEEQADGAKAGAASEAASDAGSETDSAALTEA